MSRKERDRLTIMIGIKCQKLTVVFRWDGSTLERASVFGRIEKTDLEVHSYGSARHKVERTFQSVASTCFNN